MFTINSRLIHKHNPFLWNTPRYAIELELSLSIEFRFWKKYDNTTCVTSSSDDDDDDDDDDDPVSDAHIIQTPSCFSSQSRDILTVRNGRI